MSAKAGEPQGLATASFPANQLARSDKWADAHRKQRQKPAGAPHLGPAPPLALGAGAEAIKMISPAAKRILDQAGFDVALKVYAKESEVSRFVRDADVPVHFKDGQVSFGELDEWIQEYSQREETRNRRAYDLSWVALFVAASSLIVSVLVALGYFPLAKQEVPAISRQLTPPASSAIAQPELPAATPQSTSPAPSPQPAPPEPAPPAVSPQPASANLVPGSRFR
jgi:hypothetical protein